MVAGGATAGDALTVSSEAARMVNHLLACGNQVVILGDATKLEAAKASLPISGGVSVLETDTGAEGSIEGVDSDTAGWLVSDNAELCAGAARTHRRLKTVLIGGSEATHDLAHRPADRFARSLGDAVLDILATEAMPVGPS